MEKKYKSLAELQEDIDRLKVKKFQHEEAIKDAFSSPKVAFKTLRNYFRNTNAGPSQPLLTQNLVNSDLIANLSRTAIPFLVNTFMFKRSGFIVRTLATFVSRKAASQVNTNTVAVLVGKVRGFLTKKGVLKDTKQVVVRDYRTNPTASSDPSKHF